MAERRVAQIAGHLFPKGMLAGQVGKHCAVVEVLRILITPIIGCHNYRLGPRHRRRGSADVCKRRCQGGGPRH